MPTCPRQGRARHVRSGPPGCHAILLDVIADGGEEDFARRKTWYEGFGFAAFPSDPARMFLPMKQARASVLARQEDAEA